MVIVLLLFVRTKYRENQSEHSSTLWLLCVEPTTSLALKIHLPINFVYRAAHEKWYVPVWVCERECVEGAARINVREREDISVLLPHYCVLLLLRSSSPFSFFLFNCSPLCIAYSARARARLMHTHVCFRSSLFPSSAQHTCSSGFSGGDITVNAECQIKYSKRFRMYVRESVISCLWVCMCCVFARWWCWCCQLLSIYVQIFHSSFGAAAHMNDIFMTFLTETVLIRDFFEIRT